MDDTAFTLRVLRDEEVKHRNELLREICADLEWDSISEREVDLLCSVNLETLSAFQESALRVGIFHIRFKNAKKNA